MRLQIFGLFISLLSSLATVQGQDTIRLERKPRVIISSWYPELKEFPKLKIGESKILFTKIPDFDGTALRDNDIDLTTSNSQVQIKETIKSNQYSIRVNDTKEKLIEFELWFELGNHTLLLKSDSKWKDIKTLYPVRGNRILIEKIKLEILNTRSVQKTNADLNSGKFDPDGLIKGIGLVEVNLESAFGKELIIYDSKGEPAVIVKATDDDVTTKIRSKSYSRHDKGNPFSPRVFGTNPDYFRLILDCTASTDKYYHVIIDQKTNDTGFIKKDDTSFKFETVVEYVNNWTEMGLDFDRTQNPLRQEPTENAAILSNDNQMKIKIWRAEKIEIKGDWIKVKTSNSEEGWIKWKKGSEIIIRLYFGC